MKLAPLVTLVAVLVPQTLGAGESSGTLLQSREVMTPPAWNEAPKIERYADKETYEAARGDNRFVLEELRYISGELEVVAYLYRARVSDGASAPTVIYNRGGWVSPGNPHTLLTTFNRLAEAGFTVIAPYLRGSAGAEGHDALGGADLGDIRVAIELGLEMGLVDPDRIYMYGESRGGMMTYFALRDDFPIRAAAVFGATANLEQLYLENKDLYDPILKVIWPDVETRWEEIVEQRSATAWADSLTDVPLLIMHGAQDGSVAVHHAIDLFELLLPLEAEVDLWIAAGEGHRIAGRAEERDARAIRWFETHAPAVAEID